MKVFLIHGEDNQKSYSRLKKFIEEAKKRNWEITYLDESPQTLSENVSSASLFSKTRFLVHRNFSKVSKTDLIWLSQKIQKYEGNIVFYAESSVPKSLISKLPKNTKVEEFKLPKLIWKFLESFYPGNSKEALGIFQRIKEEAAIELTFGLLARQIRDLYWVQKDSEIPGLPGWRVSKLKNQASRFKPHSLEAMISKLAEADIKTKTSQTKMEDILDFIIIEGLA